MKLKYKIFTTLIITSALILGLTVGIMQFSIRKGFTEFLNEVEFNKQKKMIELLKESYEKHAGWDAFRDKPEEWHTLLAQSRFDNEKRHPMPPPFRGPKRKGPRPNDPNSLHLRLCLFDADKTYIAGECKQESQFAYRPLTVGKKTIGWLGLENSEGLRTPLELGFIKKQTRAFYIIGAGIMIILLFVTYVASKHVLLPIKELARGTRAMRQFKFDTLVNVRSSDELGDLAFDFNQMAKTLKQYETMRKNWLSDISHELRTPVAVIRSKLEALQDGIREPTPQLLDSLHKDIMGLGKLINDLHRISLMDSENLAMKPKPVSIDSIFGQVLDKFLIRFELAGIEITKKKAPKDLPDILADPVLLTRVFNNLLENTLKYTDAPGILSVTSCVEKETVVIELSDSPPGVPDNCLESIFDRLYRVEQSRNRRLGGSGLGLSMSREIIALHKGTIMADHSSLGGLKISVKLPMAKLIKG